MKPTGRATSLSPVKSLITYVTECRLYKGVNWEYSEVSSQLDALIADLDKTVRGVSVDDVFYDL